MEKFKQFEQNYKVFNGYIAKEDPIIKYLDSGAVVCKFSLPLKKTKDDTPEWLNCECWSPVLAETIAERYKKGSEITVAGYIKESEYQGKKYYNFVVKIAM